MHRLFLCVSDVWNVSLEDAEEQEARDILANMLAAELRQVNKSPIKC